MKIKRSLLKSLVKECLVEILSDGLGSADNQLYESRSSNRRTPDNSEMIERMQARKKMLNEKISYGKNEEQAQDHSHLANSLTNDPMMAEIFRDTAQTTLMEQGMSNKAGPSYRPADGAARLAQQKDPADLFAGSENWAALAFSGGKKNS